LFPQKAQNALGSSCLPQLEQIIFPGVTSTTDSGSFGSSFWAPQLLADFDFFQCLGDRLYFKLMFRTTKNLSVASRMLFPEEK
jgi:hypothetical protein